MFKFFEISQIREPFLNELIRLIARSESNGEITIIINRDNQSISDALSEDNNNIRCISEIFALIPFEFITDDFSIKLIKCLWKVPTLVSRLLLNGCVGVRKETLNYLVKNELDNYIKFLFEISRRLNRSRTSTSADSEIKPPKSSHLIK